MHDARSVIILATVDTVEQDRFRKLLLEQRDRVTASMNGEDPAENQDLRDPEELATLITRTEVNDRLVEDDLNLLQKIDLALSRLEAGTYDQCANCGDVIPLERLLAKPSVSLCVACQELKDAGKK
jgi:DnaK suppressor protein